MARILANAIAQWATRAFAAIAVLLACSATAARADVTAVYGAGNGQTVIEVADSGDMRITRGRPDDGYLLIQGGVAYLVSPGPGGPTVITAEAAAFQQQADVAAGRIIFIEDEESKPTPLTYRAGKTVMIAGYPGTVYSAGEGKPSVTLTDRPELRPLGAAFRAFWDIMAQLSSAGTTEYGNLPALLADHGVLAFDAPLSAVHFDPIDPTRFAVPAPPITLADIQADAQADAQPDAEGTEDGAAKADAHMPRIMHAVMHQGRLLTLSADGVVEARDEGAATGSTFATPGKVAAVCVLDGALYLLTAEEEARTAQIWSGSPAQWTLAHAFSPAKEEFVFGIDCTGAEPLVLTSAAMILPLSKTRRAVAFDENARGGDATMLQHGGYLYVGLNAGEWGGGLRRFALTGGKADLLDYSAGAELCEGLLNAACGPVTGLAVDPARPECVLATTGLVHFMASGWIARICGDTAGLAYAKPYTIDTQWTFDPEAASTGGSVAFFAMASGGDGAWAVGQDGLYHFAQSAPSVLPHFTPFAQKPGRGYRIPDGGVDWSNPSFILIMTDKNRRHSLSGNSLILVPR